MKKFIFCILIVCFILSSLAQESYYTDGQKRLMARRAAMLDAYRQLAETIQGVRIDAQTTVKDFVTENDEIRANLDSFVMRGAQVVATRYLPDGTCEVDVQLNLNDMIGFLKISQSQYNSNKYQSTNFDNMAQFNQNRIFRATGGGARPDGLNAQQVQSLRDEIANLKAQVESLSQQLQISQGYQGQFNTTSQENSRLKVVLQNKENEIISLKQENYNLKNELTSLKGSYQELLPFRQDYNNLNTQNAALVQKCNSLESQNAALVQKCNSLESQNAVLAQKCNSLESQNSVLVQKCDSLESQNAVLVQKHNSLESKYNTLLAKYNILEGKQKQTSLELANAYNQANDTKNQLMSLQNTIADLQSYRQKYDELVRENSQLKQQNISIQQTITMMQSYRQKYDELLVENNQLKEQNKNIQYLQAEIARLSANNNSLSQVNQNLARENSELQRKLADVLENNNVWKNATGTQKLMAKRAATMDGYRQLLETIHGIRINSTTLVQNFVAESDEIQGEVSGFLRGAQTVATRYLPDGTCEVDVVINTKDFVEFLEQQARQYKTKISPNEMKNIYNYHKDSLIKATGSGTFK